MRPLCLAAALLFLPLHAAESPRAFPLWDGIEPIESYARRVNLPPTEQLDLGNGVTLDLVLIPAGQFIMGTPEPAKPAATLFGACVILLLGCTLVVVLLGMLSKRKAERGRLSFSLRWLLFFTTACGLTAGGVARWHFAGQEEARFTVEKAAYNALPDNEKPGHTVTLTQPFYMGKYTVAQAQYTALMGSNPSAFRGHQLPVETVSWDDASAFCAKLNERFKDKGMKAQMPTEAQWEFACRAGTTTQFYSGDSESDLDATAWYAGNSGNTTHPVGTKKPNSFGLYDMHGNVWQWCRDAYSEHYDESLATDPFNDKAKFRVLRGGSWYDIPWVCRSALRYGGTPGYRCDSFGFRVVVPLDF